MRTRVLVWSLWCLAFALAAWTLSQLPLTTVLTTVRTLSASQWGLWCGINAAVILVLTRRWKAFSDQLGVTLSFWQLLQIRQAGQAVSFITPGPQFGGEPLQLYWMHQLTPNSVPLRASLLALVLDRFFELWINFSVLLVGVLLISATLSRQGIAVGNVVLILAFLVTVLSGLGWSLLHQPAWLGGRIRALAQHWQAHPALSQLDTQWQLVGADLQALINSSGGTMLRAAAWSVLGWIGMLLEVWLLLDFLHANPVFSDYLLLMVAMRLAMLLPLPGGIGTVEAAVFWTFQSMQLPATAALGLIALMRLRDALILAGGLWCLRVLQTRTARKPV